MRLIPDEELKSDFARAMPYGNWLKEQRIRLSDLHPESEPHGFDSESLLPRMKFIVSAVYPNACIRANKVSLSNPCGSDSG